jgi:circadian clock protein KaiC
MTQERVSSGIPELDEMLGGGIPLGDVVLYSGVPGTGKTTACLHFIADGVAKGEDCIYIACEESRGKLIENAKSVGIDLEAAIHAKKLEIFQVEDIAFKDPLGRTVKLPRDPEKRIDRLSISIREWMKQADAKRLVVDSLLVYAMGDEDILLNTELFRELDALGMTSILVSELEAGSKAYSRDGVTEILADGIVLFSEKKSLRVVKMRGTAVDSKERVFKITDKGIKLKK